MAVQTTLIGHSGKHSSTSNTMDSSEDKEERKREYNRLAQREFRRRRKEHLKNLEHAQKEQDSEQSEEIERLQYENDELRRENESLRAQIYGASSSPAHGLLSTPLQVSSMPYASSSYSLSPSVSAAVISSAPPQTVSQDMIPMATLCLTSPMLPTSMQAYDPSALLVQPYTMVHPVGVSQDSISSPGSSEFRASRSLGPAFRSLNISPASESPDPKDTRRRGLSSILTPYNRNQARAELLALFHPYYSDPSIASSPERHLATLQSLSISLPTALKPTVAQLDTPHYFEIDTIASPMLRDRLLTVSSEVAQEFMLEVGFTRGEDLGQLTIWGDEPLNELSWEFSQPILERWGWLLGRDCVNRSNWWRKERGATLLPEW